MGKKKEKITYVDDGRTIADMSGVHGPMGSRKKSKQLVHPRFKEVWTTYWASVRMMLLPMLVMVGGLVVMYLLVMLIFWLM